MIHKTTIKYSKSPAKNGGYILTNGDFINFSEQESRCFVTHGYFERVFLHSRMDRSLIKTANAIAFNDAVVKMDALKQERAYIDLPASEPTNQQYSSLLDWLYHTMYVSETIDVKESSPNKIKTYTFLSSKNEDGYLPEDIIKEIKKLYKKI